MRVVGDRQRVVALVEVEPEREASLRALRGLVDDVVALRVERAVSGDGREREPGTFGEGDAAMVAPEERPAQMLLEPADLVADRGLRQPQIVRGLGEAAEPGRHLEGDQPP